MDLFEFGQYWSTSTFILFFIVGIIVSRLCYRGVKYDYRCLCEKGNKKGINQYFLFVFFILLFLYTFRSIDVGADTESYVISFLNSTSVDISLKTILEFKTREPLFTLFTYLIRKLTDNYTIYFMFIGLFISYAYTKFFRVFWNEKSTYIFLIAFVVEFLYDLNVMRTAIGMSFVMLSLCAFSEGKTWKSFILTILGTLVHYTVIVNIPLLIFLYLLRKKNQISKWKMVFLLSIGLGIIVGIVPVFSIYLLGTKYHGYVENVGSGSVLGYWYVLLSAGMALLLIFRQSKHETSVNFEENILRISCVFNIILIVINYYLGAYRLINLYTIVRLAFWDSLTLKCKNPNNIRIIKAFFYLMMVVYMLFRMSRNSAAPGFAYKLVGF